MTNKIVFPNLWQFVCLKLSEVKVGKGFYREVLLSGPNLLPFDILFLREGKDKVCV